MSYAVEVTKKAMKQLESLPGQMQERMLEAIRGLGDDPRPPGCRKLTNVEPATWRIRVGDWRALYRIKEGELVVVVVRVAHRSDVYE